MRSRSHTVTSRAPVSEEVVARGSPSLEPGEDPRRGARGHRRHHRSADLGHFRPLRRELAQAHRLEELVHGLLLRRLLLLLEQVRDLAGRDRLALHDGVEVLERLHARGLPRFLLLLALELQVAACREGLQLLLARLAHRRPAG